MSGTRHRGVAAIADGLAHAFFDGPITVWHVPDEGRRLRVMRDFFAVLLEHVYLRFGLVHTNVGAVAGWRGVDGTRRDGSFRCIRRARPSLGGGLP